MSKKLTHNPTPVFITTAILVVYSAVLLGVAYMTGIIATQQAMLLAAIANSICMAFMIGGCMLVDFASYRALRAEGGSWL